MGKTYRPLQTLGVKAAGALTAKKFVGFDGNHTGAGAKSFGVALLDHDADDEASLVVSGTVLILSGGAIAVGDAVTSDADGKAVVASNLAIEAGATAVTSSAVNGEILEGSVPPEGINGRALEAASGADEEIEILLV